MMSVGTGFRLGPYEITAKLGEGGMGQVWRARDSHLGRDVALKVLPEAFTADPERLQRFEREAKLLAQLNHPNIAHIHGLEVRGDVRALVMELVEGPTLADRLEQGPLPLPECLSVALQIAQALEEAHEKGIVHRDLKPQNVKAPLDGKVKVLDFGLAKAMEPVGGAASSVSQSPTITLGATQLGVILGTAAYMAPEQAAGAAVDRRADIWAFGVVLYEMLTGRRLFDGESVSHVLAAVLKDEPDFSALPAETPERIRNLVRRCLRKKPRARLQAIGDARIVLEEVLAGGGRDEAPATTAAAVPARAASWRPVAAIGAALLALGLAAGRWLLAPRPAPAPPWRLELAVPEGLSLNWGVGHQSVALSADGRRLAVAVVGESGGGGGLLVRDLAQLEARLLAGTEGAVAPFFSPDGEWIAYFTDKDLFKVAVAGGRPLRLAAAQTQSRGGVWGRNGTIYFSPNSDSPLLRVADSGGTVEAATELDASRQERTHRWPELSPDGEVLVFAVDTAETPFFVDDGRIEALRLASGERRVLVEKAGQARWLADDLLVFISGGNLFALAIDRRRLAPLSKPVALELEIASNPGPGAMQFAPSRRGSAVWISRDLATREESPPVWFTAGGEPTLSAVPATHVYQQLALSPDGRRAALGTGSSFGSIDTIWVADLERGTLSRFSFDEVASHPVWSPDGRRIAYRRTPPLSGAPSSTVVWQPADGGAEAEVLAESPSEILTPISFAPDGRTLVVERFARDGGDLFLLPLQPPGPKQPFQVTAFDERAATVSPDGRWIAYTSNESGDYQVYVRPFPQGRGKWQVSTDASYEPRWSSDGRRLYYRATTGGRLMSAVIEPGAVFHASAPTPIAAGLYNGPNWTSYGVHPDGRRFLALPPRTQFGRELRQVDYSDDWVLRARQLLARGGSS